jgi:hypothetical protein
MSDWNQDYAMSFASQEPRKEFILLRLSDFDGKLSRHRTGIIPKIVEKSEITRVVLMGKSKKTMEIHQNTTKDFDTTI